MTAGKSYRYTLRAVDTAGNLSTDSAAASATFPAPPPASSVASGGVYRVVNAGSGKLVDDPASSRAAGTPLIQYAFSGGGANQKWTLTANTDPALEHHPVRAAATSSWPSIQWGCSGANKQHVHRRLRRQLRDQERCHSGECLTVPGASTTNSTKLAQSACSTAASQRWTLTRVS